MQKSPWLGIGSYADPEKSKSSYKFCGRTTAANAIFAMVDNNLVITIYGRTGVGKTSILNAGVFPILRTHKYIPVSIRLSIDTIQGSSYSECIVKRITEEINNINGRIDSLSDIENLFTSINNPDFLWHYFSSTTFYNEEGEEVYPVIVLDQFEETLLTNNEQTSFLLKQINSLTDDSMDVSNFTGYTDSTNFRFILTIREDDLFVLEDTLEKHNLPELKQNRYRLASLTDEEASEIIHLGKEFIKPEELDEITSRIVALSKDEFKNISTNILSLLCNQLFIHSNGQITLQTVKVFSENPLDSFYNDCMEHVSQETRDFIESELVEERRRRIVRKSDFLSHVNPTDAQTLLSGEYRILQDVISGNTECVELIHDSIARTIYLQKDISKFKLKTKKLLRSNKRRKFSLYILAFILLSATAFGVLLWHQNRTLSQSFGKQSFTISFSEDSLISETDYWKANLSVSITKNDGSTSILLNNASVNKSIMDTIFTFLTDSVNYITITLDFGGMGRYEDIHEDIKAKDLFKNPSRKLLIRKALKTPYCLSGNVFTMLETSKKPIQDAIIIFNDMMQRTDASGHFTFYLDEEIDNNDIVYIVKKGFSCEEFKIIDNGNQPLQEYEIHAADSFLSFFNKCDEIDSIVTSNTSHVYKYSSHVTYNSQEDKLVYIAYVNGSTVDKLNIRGYYYFKSEFDKLGQKSYHILEGTLDKNWSTKSSSSNAEKRFNFESRDIVNNRQTASGVYCKTGNWKGEIETPSGASITFE